MIFGPKKHNRMLFKYIQPDLRVVVYLYRKTSFLRQLTWMGRDHGPSSKRWVGPFEMRGRPRIFDK